MPEYAEVVTFTEQLQSFVGGLIVEARGTKSDRALEFSGKRRAVRITAVSNRGKYIIAHLSNNELLIIHLGMTGRLSTNPGDKHLRLKLKFKDGRVLYFYDPRGFGRFYLSYELPKLDYIDPGERDYYPSLALKITHKSRVIYDLLLDQKVAFGVGAYLAQESLLKAGVHPLSRELTPEQAREVCKALKEVIKQAIKHKGATMRDYRSLTGEKGRMQEYFKVYGRARLPCKICNSTIIKDKYRSRSYAYCPSCQSIA